MIGKDMLTLLMMLMMDMFIIMNLKKDMLIVTINLYFIVEQIYLATTIKL